MSLPSLIKYPAKSVAVNMSLNPPQIPEAEADYEGSDELHDQRIVVPTKHITIAGSFEKKPYSWFINSHVPTDLTIQVQGITFDVHKYPLVSKCGYIGRLEIHPSPSNFSYDLKLENFPGGSETFEIILKFCYGLPVDLNPWLSFLHGKTPLLCLNLVKLSHRGLKIFKLSDAAVTQSLGRLPEKTPLGMQMVKKAGGLAKCLPPQNKALPCKFLLQMLKLAMLYSASPALISELEKRAGMMLEDADVNDLLIPRYYNADQGKLVE